MLGGSAMVRPQVHRKQNRDHINSEGWPESRSKHADLNIGSYSNPKIKAHGVERDSQLGTANDTIDEMTCLNLDYLR
jgi:hypothetical protein